MFVFMCFVKHTSANQFRSFMFHVLDYFGIVKFVQIYNSRLNLCENVIRTLLYHGMAHYTRVLLRKVGECAP